MKIPASFLYIALTLALATQTAFAADTAPVNSGPQWANPERAGEIVSRVVIQTANLMADGKYDEARPLLSKLMLAPHPGLQVLFLAAQLAEHDGDLPRAVALYRDMLNRDPALVRPRLELARVLYEQRDYDGANYHFERVLATPLPTPVIRKVERFIQIMRAQSGYFNMSISLTPDSNANNGASSRQVVIQGLNYTLSDNTQPRRMLGMDFQLNGRRNFGNDRQTFVRGFADYQTFPDHNYDFSYLLGYVGRNFKISKHVLTFEAGYHQATYGNNNPLYQGWALRAADYVRLKPNLALETAVDSRRFNYNQTNAFYTGTHTILSATTIYSPNSASQWRAGVLTTRATAELDAYAYRAVELQLANYRELSWHNLTTGVRLNLSTSRYDTTDPFFNVLRADNSERIEWDMTKRDWNWRGFAPRITFGMLRNQSNIALYDYVRSYMRLTATRDF